MSSQNHIDEWISAGVDPGGSHCEEWGLQLGLHKKGRMRPNMLFDQAFTTTVH